MIYTLLAQINNPVAKNLSPKTSGEAITKFGELLQRIIFILLTVGTLAFFFMLLIGAIKWIVSGGDKNAVESARNQITHALIGLVIMFGIFATVKLLEMVLQVCLLNIDLSLSNVTNTNCDRGGGYGGPSGDPRKI